MTKNSIHLIAAILLLIVASCKVDGNQIDISKTEFVAHIAEKEPVNYHTLKEGSMLHWRASHLGGLNPRHGNIFIKKASISVTNGVLNYGVVLIDMNKLTVEDLPEDDIQDLTEHLKSEDFFKVKTYPTSKFELVEVKRIEGEYNSELTGNLTILGKSKSITFKADIALSDSEVSIKSEDFIIDRSDWDLTYNAKGTAGVPLDYLISDDVGFTIDITVKK